MVKRFFHDALGEAVETGRSIANQGKQAMPGKIIKTAMEQVSGSSPNSDDIPGLEDLKNKKKTPLQLQQMKKRDNQNKSQKIDQTRIGLKKMIIQRYQQMQEKIKRKEEERDQEEVNKKRKEMAEKQREKEEKQKESGLQMPKGKKPRGTLGIFSKQKRGSGEMKIGKAG